MNNSSVAQLFIPDPGQKHSGNNQQKQQQAKVNVNLIGLISFLGKYLFVY